MAWVTASPGLVSAVRSAKQYLTYVSSGPFQYAVAEALALPDTYFDAFRADMPAKRDLLSAGFAEAGFAEAGFAEAGFAVYRPAGTYFITTDIRPLGAALSGKGDGYAFCRSLPERAGVVAIPNAVFYDHREAGAPFVRFAFCKRRTVPEEAAERLKSLTA